MRASRAGATSGRNRVCPSQTGAECRQLAAHGSSSNMHVDIILNSVYVGFSSVLFAACCSTNMQQPVWNVTRQVTYVTRAWDAHGAHHESTKAWRSSAPLLYRRPCRSTTTSHAVCCDSRRSLLCHAISDVMGTASVAGHASEQQAFAPAGPSCCNLPFGALLHARQILPRMQPQNSCRGRPACIQTGVHRTPSTYRTRDRA
jgi:hypothetical protein